MQYTSNLASQRFYSLLNEVANDIAVASSNPVLKNYIHASSPAHLKDLQDLFSVILNNKAHYYQIRLLDVNNQGKEILRYDKIAQRVIATDESQLQFKGDRKYYKEALTIPKGSYYYSDINLNEEYGAVSKPLTPTLRAVGQVYSQQQLVALIVINVDLSIFYDELNQIMESSIQLMMIDREGQYLFAPDMEKCFAQQLGHQDSFQADFGKHIDELFPKSEDYQFIQDQLGKNFLYHLVPIPYPREQQIYLVTLLEDDLLFKSAYLVRNNSLKIMVVICILATIVVFLFTRISSRRINQITQAVRAYEEGDKNLDSYQVSPSRKDEIGLLAGSLARMRNRIDQQLADLKKAVNREKQAIKERDRFLQNMSHEIRTPLNAILGLSKLLNKNKPSLNQQPIIESLNRSATNLSSLMYDILDHNKLIEGKVDINLSPQNFFDLLSDIHAGYQYEAINKGLSFNLSVDHQLRSTQCLTDPLRFKQIITNLVVNAIKYTDKGTIELSAKCVDTDHTPMLEVKISDSGKGISGENIKYIHQRFYREKEVSRIQAEGFGLGLSIVTQLVDLFGGKLEVSSQENIGSEFKVLLPLLKARQTEDKSLVADHEVALPTFAKSYRILHIEDDPSTCLMISNAISMDCFKINQVSSMDDALEAIDLQPPDLIISDLMLGNTLVHSQLLHIVNKHPEMPLMVLSAFDDPEVEQLNACFLQKPLDLDFLLDLVMVVLGRSEYDPPQLESSYVQYDWDPEKIKNFLSILLQEFQKYQERFEKVYLSRDFKEWEAIMHKITTHIKNLKLEKLANQLPENPEQFKKHQLNFIRNQILYCLCTFRVESRINSTGGSYLGDLSRNWR